MYIDAEQLADDLKKAEIKVANLSSDVELQNHRLNKKKAKIKQQLIGDFGNEKKIGDSVTERERKFDLALNNDPNYDTLFKQLNTLKLQFEEAKIEVSYLRNILEITMTVMKSGQS